MEIIPPGLLPVSRQDYLNDLRKREELDCELIAERADRLGHLFKSRAASPG